MSTLFARDKSVISRHLKRIFGEGELARSATVARNATVQLEGEREVVREIASCSATPRRGGFSSPTTSGDCRRPPGGPSLPRAASTSRRCAPPSRAGARRRFRRHSGRRRADVRRRHLYPTAQSRAAHLLYFVIKDHPFGDGNKRIGAFLFLEALRRSGLFYREDGAPRFANNALVALALLIAESAPTQKDLMIRTSFQGSGRGRPRRRSDPSGAPPTPWRPRTPSTTMPGPHGSDRPEPRRRGARPR
ncbi:MAG TPA: virulence protein RhuM/Fic/DOC family protein [Planctomycetota bacterium]|nr:virulence protein RhuM/Fic/DOC family protein [Planctomycetota bacterium]